MREKKRILGVVLLLLCLALGRIAYYTMPVKLSYLENVESCSQVSVLPSYKGLELYEQKKILEQDEILELKEFLQNSTFSRRHGGTSIPGDRYHTYHISFKCSDGTSVQLRTLGENAYGTDSFVWDTGGKIIFLQAHDENWHNNLEKLLTE